MKTANFYFFLNYNSVKIVNRCDLEGKKISAFFGDIWILVGPFVLSLSYNFVWGMTYF